MQAGSLVGFAVVFVAICAGLSALATGALLLGRARLRSAGPAVERRAASVAAALPVLLALSVVGVLIAHALLGADHCPTHSHHAHLCLRHGGAWADEPWAIALLAATAVVLLGRAALLLASVVRGARVASGLRAASDDVDGIRVVDSAVPFCVVAGVAAPTVFASTSALAQLDADERGAMIAHERAHVRAGDVLWRLGLDVATLVAAPLAPGVLRAVWEDATERLRDVQAAAATSPDAVARALVHMARLGAPRLSATAFPAAGDAALSTRVHALLDGSPSGERAAGVLGLLITMKTVVVLVLLVLGAEPIHHAIETLLG
jgi:hypothetical protein